MLRVRPPSTTLRRGGLIKTLPVMVETRVPSPASVSTRPVEPVQTRGRNPRMPGAAPGRVSKVVYHQSRSALRWRVARVKTCCRCRIGKPLTDYNRSSRSIDGVQAHCRACSKGYYQNNAVVHKANTGARRDSVRRDHAKRIWDYLADHPCCDCGESDPSVLDFDHVRGIKVAAVSRMVRDGVSWGRIEDEVAKCEVRCANCHRRRTAKQFGWYAWLAEA